MARSERFMVALCTCRRSRVYPWCDTSHRPRQKRDASLTAEEQRKDPSADHVATGDRSALKQRQDRNVR
ncbi:CDGSH iron-sulfur domain-containing protein [Streptomyces sp. NPDC051362]|uniref:CDGSH iron-sulfur domain-containing protein n=1 Tax=Streptomyces sp. NPDC051362 TaxID=3365651 RepID=UPI00379B0463